MKSTFLGSASTSLSTTWQPPGVTGMVTVTVPPSHEVLNSNDILVEQKGAYKFRTADVVILAFAGNQHC